MEGKRSQGMSTLSLKAIGSHALRDAVRAKLHESERAILNRLADVAGYRGYVGATVTQETISIKWKGIFR